MSTCRMLLSEFILEVLGGTDRKSAVQMSGVVCKKSKPKSVIDAAAR